MLKEIKPQIQLENLQDVFLATLSLFVASLQAKLKLDKAWSEVSVCFNV